MRATRSRQVENFVGRSWHRVAAGSLSATDGEVFEARGPNERGVVQIAAVEHEAALSSAAASAAKSGLRNSFHSVTTTSASAPATASIGVAANCEPRRHAERPARRRHGDGIVGDDVGAAQVERRDDLERRRFAHIVRVRLEREPPYRESAALEIRAQARDDLLDEPELLRLVGRFDGGQNLAAAGRAPWRCAAAP